MYHHSSRTPGAPDSYPKQTAVRPCPSCHCNPPRDPSRKMRLDQASSSPNLPVPFRGLGGEKTRRHLVRPSLSYTLTRLPAPTLHLQSISQSHIRPSRHGSSSIYQPCYTRPSEPLLPSHSPPKGHSTTGDGAGQIYAVTPRSVPKLCLPCPSLHRSARIPNE